MSNDTAQDRLGSMLLQYRVELFLYDEAALLDARRFAEWLELFSEDTHYFMPIRRTRTRHELDREFTPPGEMALRRVGESLQIARRTIYLEQTVLLSRNLSNFF